jgi:hypothetical protein
MVSNNQATGRGIRARNQAMIREAGEQGRAAVSGCFLASAAARGLSCQGNPTMKTRTLVVVENLIFGTRGSFRTDSSPARIAQWVFMCLEIDDFPDPAMRPTEWGTGDYCDNGPAAAAVALGPNRVTVRYHAAGSQEEAAEWFLANAHVLADGTLGGHGRAKNRRAVP